MSNRYQIRHKELGLFQGDFMGLCFWWPDSEMPEQGICSLSLEDAQFVINQHFVMKDQGSEMNASLNREDFIIEPFDEIQNQMMLLSVKPSEVLN